MSPKRRLFIQRRSKRGVLLTLATIGLVAMVAACAPEASHWYPTENVKRNDVRWISFEHTVRFSGGETALNSIERKRLEQFLSGKNAGYGDQILIGAQGTRLHAGQTRVAARREAAVSASLRENDLSSRLLPQVPSNARWDGTVKVVLGRFVIVPPDCPDWSKEPNGDSANRQSSNFGCASTTNLGLMVANPGDLIRGRTAGPADGAAGARRYKLYRDGEQKQSPSITPLVIQSGVEGSGG